MSVDAITCIIMLSVRVCVCASSQEWKSKEQAGYCHKRVYFNVNAAENLHRQLRLPHGSLRTGALWVTQEAAAGCWITTTSLFGGNPHDPLLLSLFNRFFLNTRISQVRSSLRGDVTSLAIQRFPDVKRVEQSSERWSQPRGGPVVTMALRQP